MWTGHYHVSKHYHHIKEWALHWRPHIYWPAQAHHLLELALLFPSYPMPGGRWIGHDECKALVGRSLSYTCPQQFPPIKRYIFQLFHYCGLHSTGMGIVLPSSFPSPNSCHLCLLLERISIHSLCNKLKLHCDCVNLSFSCRVFWISVKRLFWLTLLITYRI